MSGADLEVFEVVTRRRAGPEPVVVVADVCCEGGRGGITGQS